MEKGSSEHANEVEIWVYISSSKPRHGVEGKWYAKVLKITQRTGLNWVDEVKMRCEVN